MPISKNQYKAMIFDDEKKVLENNNNWKKRKE